MEQKKTCRWCEKPFEITDDDLAFYEKVSPVFQGKKYLIPSPTLCPQCRQQRRLSWRNERKLYTRASSVSGKEIVSIYSPDKPLRVLEAKEWWADTSDPKAAGRNYSTTKSFFEQFRELFLAAPLMNLVGAENTESAYCNLSAYNKGSYLLIESSSNENSHYSYWLQESMACIDCSFSNKCQYGYELENCNGCYNLSYAKDCNNCSDSYFLENCTNCKNCFGCVNLRHKEYYIFNTFVGKEAYEKFMQEQQPGSAKWVTSCSEKMKAHALKFPRKANHIVDSEDCSGEYILHCKNCEEVYHAIDSQHCKFAEHIIRNTRFCMDVSTIGLDTELIYEAINTAISAYSNAFTVQCWSSSYMYYCYSCFNSKNCFGCVGLKNAEYCILNKQYTKAEYEKLVPRIIELMQKNGEWGEFFPSSLSPFGYNGTVAQEYFPLTREQTKSNNRFNWSDYESPPPQVEKIISKDQMARLPDNIKDIPDEIVNWALTCEISGKPYRIIKQELQFYREHHIPVPRRHPDQRHKDRLALRNPRRLWERQCDCDNTSHNHHTVETQRVASLPNVATRCPVTFQTSYAPDRPEIVFCEKCYLKEVY